MTKQKRQTMNELLRACAIILVGGVQVILAETVVVTNAESFAAALKNKEASEIVLEEGIYEGNFESGRRFLDIKGRTKGKVTIKQANPVKFALSLDGALFRDSAINIENLIFEGAGATSFNTLYVRFYGDVKLTGVITDSFLGVDLSSCTNIRIVDSTFIGYGGLNVDCLYGSNLISNCTFSRGSYTNYSVGLELKNMNSYTPLKIEQCKFDNRVGISMVNTHEDFELMLTSNTINSVRPIKYNKTSESSGEFQSILNLNATLTEEIWSYFTDWERKAYDETKAGLATENLAPPLKEAILAQDNTERVILLQRYLSEAMRDAEAIGSETPSIALAIKLMSLPPFFSYSVFGQNEAREDLLGLQLTNNPWMWELAFIVNEDSRGRDSDALALARRNISIDGSSIQSIIGWPPSSGVDCFRTNLKLYQMYRENLTTVETMAKTLFDYSQSSKAPIVHTRAARDLMTSLTNIKVLGDKHARLYYFEFPLQMIMLQVAAAIEQADGDKEKLEAIGVNFASYGIIKSRGIVGASTGMAFEGLTNQFKKEFGRLSKRRYNRFVAAMEKIPPWWQDTGAKLLQDTEMK
jgi:hypothetical protein